MTNSNLPFMGVEMVCIMSGRRLRSNPEVSSNWDCIVADGQRFYVSDTWREESYKKRGAQETWVLIMKKIHSLRKGRG